MDSARNAILARGQPLNNGLPRVLVHHSHPSAILSAAQQLALPKTSAAYAYKTPYEAYMLANYQRYQQLPPAIVTGAGAAHRVVYRHQTGDINAQHLSDTLIRLKYGSHPYVQHEPTATIESSLLPTRDTNDFDTLAVIDSGGVRIDEVIVSETPMSSASTATAMTYGGGFGGIAELERVFGDPNATLLPDGTCAATLGAAGGGLSSQCKDDGDGSQFDGNGGRSSGEIDCEKLDLEM